MVGMRHSMSLDGLRKPKGKRNVVLDTVLATSKLANSWDYLLSQKVLNQNPTIKK